MWRQNRTKIIVTSLTTLIPCLIGLVLWNKLPELVPTHFNFQGVADDWSGKPFAVFALPGFFFVCQLICVFAILHDPKNESVGGKIVSILLWFLPMTSLVTSICIYMYALNMQINISFIYITLIGIIQIVLGNLMPKLRHNYTVGIKISWTLADPENWYHTHRVAGWSCVISGVLILATSLLMSPWLMLILVTAGIAVPIVYSFIYYRRHKSQG